MAETQQKVRTMVIQQQQNNKNKKKNNNNIKVKEITVMPLYLLIQYPWFQLYAVYHGPKRNWKIKEINVS
jgi:hypothetical protein